MKAANTTIAIVALRMKSRRPEESVFMRASSFTLLRVTAAREEEEVVAKMVIVGLYQAGPGVISKASALLPVISYTMPRLLSADCGDARSP
jgi:hypothetical protein